MSVQPSPSPRGPTADEVIGPLQAALEIEAVLERRLRRPVQVVALDVAPLELTQNVLRSGWLIMARDDRARARFFERHVREYLDLGHAREIFARYMDRRIREGRFGGGTRNRP